MATKDLFNEVQAPTTLQKIVTLRAELLSDDARGVLQRASVIGSSFDYKLLKELLGPQGRETLDESLKLLEKSEFVFERSKFPQKRYEFRNSSVYRIVYDSISPIKKVELHGEIAAYLESLFGDGEDEKLLVLAEHFSKSSHLEKAIEYSFKAGKYLFKNYRLRQALSFFIRAYDLLNEVPGKPDIYGMKKHIFKYKWEIYLLLGNYELSLKTLNSLKSFINENDIEEALELKRMAAEILIEKGDLGRALEILQEVKGICVSKNLNEILLKVLKPVAFIRVFREELEEARSVCEDGLFLCGEDDRSMKGHFLNFLGLVDYCRNGYTNATAYFNKALSLFKQQEDKALVGKLYCNLGMVYFKRGRYEEAEDCYRKSYDILNGIEYKRALAITNMNLAVLYDHIGSYERSITRYKTVLKECEETGNSRITMMVLCNLGDVFLRLGHYKQSISYLKEANAWAERIGSQFWKCLSLLYIGTCYQETGEMQLAKVALEDAVKIGEAFGDKCKLMEARLELVKGALERKESLEQARKLYDEIHVNKDIGSSEDLMYRALYLLGMAEALHGSMNSAGKLLDKGLHAALKDKNDCWTFQFSCALAEHYDLNNDTKIAMEYIQKAKAAFVAELQRVPLEYRRYFWNKPRVMDFSRMLSKYGLSDLIKRESIDENDQRSF